jgi:hypothetical protein
VRKKHIRDDAPSLKKRLKQLGFTEKKNWNSKPLTIKMLQTENPLYTASNKSSVDFYINKVLDQQEELYGYVSKKTKLKRELDKDLAKLKLLEDKSWNFPVRNLLSTTAVNERPKKLHS